ncbi:hypothetical protein [Sinorhizobium sp. BG8]|uniref:capsular polysaccharide export protein, LipB/KpsS family n=1 Tax=Sinorhizobium sp. BG8 TaxID=2613773 RepID=UPI002485D5FC|nr:hypothetical protein [Sinorhizobium sp. BG8]
MTSLAGFEALLRGKATGVHGLPFYAGWGLTDDRLPIERRTRRITLDMLVAAALILYPFYIHPLSGMPCRPEEIVGAFSANRSRKTSPGHAIVTFVAQRVNRVAVKLRDGRLK